MGCRTPDLFPFELLIFAGLPLPIHEPVSTTHLSTLLPLFHQILRTDQAMYQKHQREENFTREWFGAAAPAAMSMIWVQHTRPVSKGHASHGESLLRTYCDSFHASSFKLWNAIPKPALYSNPLSSLIILHMIFESLRMPTVWYYGVYSDGIGCTFLRNDDAKLDDGRFSNSSLPKFIHPMWTSQRWPFCRRIGHPLPYEVSSSWRQFRWPDDIGVHESGLSLLHMCNEML